MSTEEVWYSKRLQEQSSVWWKRLLDVQLPYRVHLLRLKPKKTLDLGCGVGRYLRHLQSDSVGVDHNPTSVEACRSQGLRAYTPDDFAKSDQSARATFDSLLMSHVAEHMTIDAAIELIKEYLPYVRPGGQLIVFTPQEVGYRSDPTHIEFIDFPKLKMLVELTNCTHERLYSYPFPRIVGKLFRYNEFVLTAKTP